MSSEITANEKSFLFSVIMPVYNSGLYLDEAINSILGQTLNFEENVQLILVDDGSKDNSIKICEEYHEKYPDNILFLEDPHSGQSTARNAGIKKASGRYISFLDSDDILAKNALEEVYNFFTEHETEVDVVSIPVIPFERKVKKDKLKTYSNTRIIDLEQEPNNPQLSIVNNFIKGNVFNELNLKFDEKLPFSEDSLLINQILLHNSKMGVLSNTQYRFRKRRNLSAVGDTAFLKEEYFTDRLIGFHEKLLDYRNKMDKTSLFIDYALIYDLEKFIPSTPVYEDSEKVNELLEKLTSIINQLDKSSYENNIYLDESAKKFLEYMSNNQEKEIVDEEENIYLKSDEYTLDLLNYHPIYIDLFDIDDDELYLEGFMFSDFDDENVIIKSVLEGYGECQLFDCELLDDNDSLSKKFLSVPWQNSHHFSSRIPLQQKDSELYFKVMHKNSMNTFNGILNFNSHSGLSNKETFKKEPYIIRKYPEKLCIHKDCLENDLEDYRFVFSIVIAVYNAEDYLDETVNSILKQNFSFEDNVQLILVDDGSTDNSLNICRKYEEKYPDNISVISKENGGQASARNVGLELAEGLIVNFLDSDDLLSPNTLTEIYNFFDKYYKKTDVVAIPLTLFGRVKGEHLLNTKFKQTRLVNLDKEPENIQLSGPSCFIIRESIKDLRFPENIIGSEDAHFINKLLLEKRTLGLVKEAMYYYRKHYTSDSTLDNMSLHKEFYIDRMKYHFLEIINYSINKYNKVPLFIQYMLSYDLHWMLNNDEIEVLDKTEFREFMFYIDNVLKVIQPRAFIKNPYIDSKIIKNFYLYLKFHKLTSDIREDTVVLKGGNYNIDNLKVHNIWIDIIEIEENTLYISGFLNSYFNSDNILIEAVKYNEDDCEAFEAKKVYYSNRDDTILLGTRFQYCYNFDVEIPLDVNEESEIKLRVSYIEDEEKCVECFLGVGLNLHARLSRLNNYHVYDDYILTFDDNTFFVKKYSYQLMRKLESETVTRIKDKDPLDCSTILRLRFVYVLLYPIIRFMMKKRPLYLFMDRPNKADDNGEELFKYSTKIRDNVKKVFVVSKDSPDLYRLKKLGIVVDYKSNWHKFLYLLASKVITSHPDESVINPFYSEDMGEDSRDEYHGLVNSKIYFLQHGVTKDDISYYLRKYDKNLSLIVTVSDDERYSFFTDKYNYDTSIVQTLGFPRFDCLSNENTKKQVLIIPSWRNYLEGSSNDFLSSEFYASINTLLNDERLIGIANKYGYSIVFKGHPRLEETISDESDQRYIDLFEINDYIKVSTQESYKELFEASSIMITDYSSVFFDFAYLEKPIIYYHYADDYHHEEDYFNYETMGFGDVITDNESLVNKVEYYMENDDEVEEVYIERSHEFFKYHDKNNSKRVYEWIKNN